MDFILAAGQTVSVPELPDLCDEKLACTICRDNTVSEEYYRKYEVLRYKKTPIDKVEAEKIITRRKKSILANHQYINSVLQQRGDALLRRWNHRTFARRGREEVIKKAMPDIPSKQSPHLHAVANLKGVLTRANRKACVLDTRCWLSGLSDKM